MERFVRKFWTEEDGNTTIDWMVLTAGLVLLCSAVLASVGQPAQDIANEAGEVIDEIDPQTGV